MKVVRELVTIKAEEEETDEQHNSLGDTLCREDQVAVGRRFPHYTAVSWKWSHFTIDKFVSFKYSFKYSALKDYAEFWEEGYVERLEDDSLQEALDQAMKHGTFIKDNVQSNSLIHWGNFSCF